MSANPTPSNDGPIIIEVDYVLHTDEHPFCPVDPSCGCHEDVNLIAPIAQAVQDGLCTPEEATNIVMGKTL